MSIIECTGLANSSMMVCGINTPVFNIPPQPYIREIIIGVVGIVICALMLYAIYSSAQQSYKSHTGSDYL